MTELLPFVWILTVICGLICFFGLLRYLRQARIDAIHLEHQMRMESEEQKTQRASIYANRDLAAAQLEAQAMGLSEKEESGGIENMLMSFLSTPQGVQMVSQFLGGAGKQNPGNFPAESGTTASGSSADSQKIL